MSAEPQGCHINSNADIILFFDRNYLRYFLLYQQMKFEYEIASTTHLERGQPPYSEIDRAPIIFSQTILSQPNLSRKRWIVL